MILGVHLNEGRIIFSLHIPPPKFQNNFLFAMRFAGPTAELGLGGLFQVSRRDKRLFGYRVHWLRASNTSEVLAISEK